MLPVAVLAGGLGTRVRHRTGPMAPKALLNIAGTPFIDLKLRELGAGGATRVVMLVGHGATAITDHVKDGSAFDLEVEYVHDPPGLMGTGGAVRHALPALGEAFLLTYGDTLLDVPMERLERRLLSSRALAVMTVLENQDRWETSNVDVVNGRVTSYEKTPSRGSHRFLDYGMTAMRSAAFEAMPMTSFDLGVVVQTLVEQRTILALPVSRRFYDIGNEESILTTERFLTRHRSP